MQIMVRYFQKRRRLCIAAALLAGLLGICLVFAVSHGAAEIPFATIVQVAAAKMAPGGDAQAVPPNIMAVVWEIRLPRAICGVLVGMGLALAGCIFQSLLKNPLADPYTIGVSTGAAFGACLAIYLQLKTEIILSQTGTAFFFAVLTVAAVLALCGWGGGIDSANIVIAGIIVSAILSSGLSLLKMLAGEQVGAIVFWLMGSLSSATWDKAGFLFPIVLGCGILAMVFSRELNLMTLGDLTARSLGVNTTAIRLGYLLLGAAVTAACVSASGVIGFVGLVVPHLLRFWISADNRILLPFSMLLGGLLLVLADNGTRLLFSSEIPVGVVTTLLGGPFFLLIFVRSRRGGGDV